jgi:hypothetical protein
MQPNATPDPAYQVRPFAAGFSSKAEPTGFNLSSPLAVLAFATYADNVSVVVPAAVEEIVTGDTENEYVAFSESLVLAEKATDPVKPFTGVTVYRTPGASEPAFTVTVVVAGVKLKSPVVAEVISIVTDPFDARYSPSPEYTAEITWLPDASADVESDSVATALVSVTAPPDATLSTRNCTVPVGTVEFAAPPFPTVAVIVTAVPAVTDVALAASVVVEVWMPVEPEDTGVTSVHVLARLYASTEPHPVARS